MGIARGSVDSLPDAVGAHRYSFGLCRAAKVGAEVALLCCGDGIDLFVRVWTSYWKYGVTRREPRFFRPFRAGVLFAPYPGLRPGLQSFAASRLMGWIEMGFLLF